jgi:hypothetical protein
MKSKLSTLFSLVSLMLCVATCVLWVRSYAHATWFLPHSEGLPLISLRSQAGWLTLRTLPPVPRHDPDAPTVLSLAGKMRDERDLKWEIWRYPIRSIPEAPHFREGSPPHQLLEGISWSTSYDGNPPKARYRTALLVPVMLQALADERRVLAAHVVLCQLYSGQPPVASSLGARRRSMKLDGGAFRIDFGGIAADITPLDDDPKPGLAGDDPVEILACAALVNRSGLPAVRRAWWDRLMVDRFSLPYPSFAVLTGLPAMASATRFLHRRRRVRSACPSCGYDLRATPDRCPECGRAATRKEAA